MLNVYMQGSAHSKKNRSTGWFRIYGIVLILTVLLFGSFLTYRNMNDVYFEVEIKTSQNIISQVYYDVGAGINEKDSVSLSVGARPDYQIVRFPLPNGTIRALRFDPLSTDGTVSLRNARLSGRENTPISTESISSLNQILDLVRTGDEIIVAPVPHATDPQLLIQGGFFPLHLSAWANVFPGAVPILAFGTLALLLGVMMRELVCARTPAEVALRLSTSLTAANSAMNKMVCVRSARALFLLLAVSFGLIYIVIIPPFQNPDEGSHFFRAVRIAEGYVLHSDISHEGMAKLPLQESLLNIVSLAQGGQAFHPENKTSAAAIIASLQKRAEPSKASETVLLRDNTYLYSPFSYIPAAIAVGLGKTVSASPVVWMYLARLANILFWAMAVAFAISIIPTGKWILVFLALTPMSLSIASAVSADGVLYGVAYVFVALSLASSHRKEMFTRGELIPFLLFSACLALCKSIYVPIILTFLLIPRSRFRSTVHYFGYFGMVVTVALLAQAGWAMCLKELNLSSETTAARSQLAFILADPLRFCTIFVDTLISQGFYINSFIAQLGWLDTHFPPRYSTAYLIVLLALGVSDGASKYVLKWNVRGLLFSCWALLSFAVFLAAYLAWNQIGSPVIAGVQGRYFIPFAPLLLLSLKNKFIRLDVDKCIGCTALVLFASLLFSVDIIFTRYYIA